MSLNRLVVLLTPVFAGVSGWLVQWVGDHFPGAPSLDQGELTALFVAGAAAAVSAAYKWLDGWQKHEEREHWGSVAPGTQPVD